jgi:hypothetical protein
VHVVVSRPRFRHVQRMTLVDYSQTLAVATASKEQRFTVSDSRRASGGLGILVLVKSSNFELSVHAASILAAALDLSEPIAKSPGRGSSSVAVAGWAFLGFISIFILQTVARCCSYDLGKPFW